MSPTQPTLLDYDVVPDRTPLYTSVDEHSQNKVSLTFTIRNNGDDAVTVSKVQLLLYDTSQGPDTVGLILPGTEGGIIVPPTVPGPGQSSWLATNAGGLLTLTPEPGGSSATFQGGDSMSFVAQSVVIREGGTGTAAIEVFEGTSGGLGAGRAEVAVTESALSVKLWVETPGGGGMIEPQQIATLRWQTTAATIGLLTVPFASPDSITLPNPQYGLSLESGQYPVSPIVDTTYTLRCQGSGPDVVRQVTVAVDSLQMGDLEVAPNLTVAKGATAWLFWQTNADDCWLSSQAGGGQGLRAALMTNSAEPAPPPGSTSVPASVPNQQYPDGYPVVVQETTTYTLVANRQQGSKWQQARRSATLTLGRVALESFAAVPQTPTGPDGKVVVNPGDPVTLTWETEYATPNSVSIITLAPDGQTAVVASGLPGESQPDKPLVVRPTQTTLYLLGCEGFGGPLVAGVKVYVSRPVAGMEALGRSVNVFGSRADDPNAGGQPLFNFSLPPATQPVDPTGRGGGYWINPDTDEAHVAPKRVLFAPDAGLRQPAGKLDTPAQAGDYYAEQAGVPTGGGAFSTARQ